MQINCETLFSKIDQFESISFLLNNKYRVTFDDLKTPSQFSFKKFFSDLLINFNEKFNNMKCMIEESSKRDWDFFIGSDALTSQHENKGLIKALKDQIENCQENFNSSLKIWVQKKLKNLGSIDLVKELKALDKKTISLFHNTLQDR